MNPKHIAASALMGLALSGAVPAQPAPADAPAQQGEVMAQMMGSMLPMMRRMIEATIDEQLKAAERPDTAKRIAKFKRQLYEALLSQGFAKDEALQLVIHTPAPSAAMASK